MNPEELFNHPTSRPTPAPAPRQPDEAELAALQLYPSMRPTAPAVPTWLPSTHNPEPAPKPQAPAPRQAEPAQPPAQAQQQPQQQVVPERYTFEVPADLADLDFQPDPALHEEFSQLARSHGLSQEAAQTLVSFHLRRMAEML